MPEEIAALCPSYGAHVVFIDWQKRVRCSGAGLADLRLQPVAAKIKTAKR